MESIRFRTLTNKLARRGDLKTFQDLKIPTAVDTQRLGIGTTGQVLRATSGLHPLGIQLILQSKVYYVLRNGVDDTSQGGSNLELLDLQWHTC